MSWPTDRPHVALRRDQDSIWGMKTKPGARGISSSWQATRLGFSAMSHSLFKHAPETSLAGESHDEVEPYLEDPVISPREKL